MKDLCHVIFFNEEITWHKKHNLNTKTKPFFMKDSCHVIFFNEEITWAKVQAFLQNIL
jgi:hypothetical protein